MDTSASAQPIWHAQEVQSYYSGQDNSQDTDSASVNSQSTWMWAGNNQADVDAASFTAGFSYDSPHDTSCCVAGCPCRHAATALAAASSNNTTEAAAGDSTRKVQEWIQEMEVQAAVFEACSSSSPTSSHKFAPSGPLQQEPPSSIDSGANVGPQPDAVAAGPTNVPNGTHVDAPGFPLPPHTQQRALSLTLTPASHEAPHSLPPPAFVLLGLL